MDNVISSIRGQVDGFDGSFIRGWALQATGDTTCLVKISTPDGRVIAEGRASHTREDLRNVGDGRNNFAFRIPVKYPPDVGALHVTADGIALSGSPCAIGRGLFDGAFIVRSGIIRGRVTERAINTRPPRVRFEDQYGHILAEGDAFFATDRDSANVALTRFELPLRPECFGFEELAVRALANDVEFARSSCSARLLGFLDCISPTQCSGWLLSPDAPQQQFEIDVFHNGERVGGGRCDVPRHDLKGVHPLAWKSGFDFRLTDEHKICHVPPLVSIRLAGSETELFDGPFLLAERIALVATMRRAAASIRSDEHLSSTERAVVQMKMAEMIQMCRQASAPTRVPLDRSRCTGRDARRFNIIIPIFKGVAITRACIQSVLATRDPHRDAVILINDCSPEPDMARLLAEISERPGVYLLDNEVNLGFVGTVNRALAFCRTGDVVLLNSDTRVFAGAWNEMEKLLVAGPNIGTITALSNNATIFSYPHITTIASSSLADLRWDELAAAALEANTGQVLDVPTGHGFCMLIRRAVLDGIGHLDSRFGRGYGEENDLCMRAADHGWRNVAACAVFVEHRESVSFQDEKATLIGMNMPQIDALYPEYTANVMAFQRTDGLRAARWPLDRLRLRRAVAAGSRYMLLVRNSLGGGTNTAIQDIESANDDDGCERITLTFRTDGSRELDVSMPLIHAVFAVDEDAPLFALIDDAGVEVVAVHQLLGATADFVRQFGTWGSARRMTFYMHDFYTICPRVTMLDASHRFCRAADSETCTRCVALGGSHEASLLADLSPVVHRARFADFLRQCANVIAPSNDTVNWAHRVFPDIAIAMSPHPQHGRVFRDTVREGDLDQIALLGAIGRQKGSRRLLELARDAYLRYPAVRFHVVGYTDIDEELRSVGNVAITGPYQAEEQGSLVDRTRSRVALFLPEAPETFSYTLTEAWSLGLWPITERIGAIAERVTDKKNGSVVDVLDMPTLVGVLESLRRTDSNGLPRPVFLSHYSAEIEMPPPHALVRAVPRGERELTSRGGNRRNG